MALLFTRRLAIPVWAIGFLIVALATPAHVTASSISPAALFVLAITGILVIVFSMPSAIEPLRMSRIAAPAGAGTRHLDEPSRRSADDALDFARLADDGG